MPRDVYARVSTQVCVYIIYTITHKHLNTQASSSKRLDLYQGHTHVQWYIPPHICLPTCVYLHFHTTCPQVPNHLCSHAPSGWPTVAHPRPCHMCLTPHPTTHTDRHVPPKPVSHTCAGSEPWHVGAHTPTLGSSMSQPQIVRCAGDSRNGAHSRKSPLTQNCICRKLLIC